MSGTTNTNQFTVSSGQIIGPNGQPFVARGVDVVDSDISSIGNAIETNFPGTNMVRIAVESGYQPSSYFESFVNQLTSEGIVVEIGNYNDMSYANGQWGWSSLTGSALTQEANWYASLATAFINN